MIGHGVEICPDDVGTLRGRLDELTLEGVRIVAVLWQPHNPAAKQAAALESRGSFVIVTETRFDDPLRLRYSTAEEVEPAAG